MDSRERSCNQLMIYLTDPTSHQSSGSVDNLGDVIIKDAILDNLGLGNRDDLRWIALDGSQREPAYMRADKLLLAGANILANNPHSNPYVWRPTLRSWLTRQTVILLGVGWWQYQPDPDLTTRLFYRRLLKRQDILHSVRDAYTQAMLIKCGLTNVINTACPTMWRLPERFTFRPPKSLRVVFTLTDYSKDPKLDAELVRTLHQEYKDIAFFPQGTGDVAYLDTLVDTKSRGRIQILERSIEAYNALLSCEPVDYVGTRLHGGIRALQKNRRVLIIAVDNRATEISKDTGLPVLERTDIASLTDKINTVFDFTLNINRDGIRRFRECLVKCISKA